MRIGKRTRPRQLDIIIKGSSHNHWRDPYHIMLTVNWPIFFGLIAVCYLTINIVFALLYLAGGNCIENARPGAFLDVFFFSVQTMASIGYGAMYPVTSYANIIVTIEALVGLMALAMATGLMFARFSRPTARVIFSRRAVIAPHNGVTTLMFRTANERDNRILEAQLRVSFLRNEVTLEGESMRRFYDLKLLRSQTPSFGLTWTAMHPIDESSPLYGETPESLAEMEATLVITLVGIDETVSQTIHSRHSYTASEILWDRRFVDMFDRKSDGSRIIDYSHFHDVKE